LLVDAAALYARVVAPQIVCQADLHANRRRPYIRASAWLLVTPEAFRRLLAYSAPMIDRTWRDRARLGLLAAVTFVLAHDIAFLLTFGSSWQAVLARTGHGNAWNDTALVVVGLAVALAIAGLARLGRLARMARSLGGGRSTAPQAGHGALVQGLRRAWLAIFPVSLALFIVVENVERMSAGLPAPGLDVMGSLGFAGIAVLFGIVAGVTALVDALYRWRRAVLIARIEAARRCPARASAVGARPGVPWVERRHAAIAGHRIAGRAPPRALAA